MKTFDVFGAMPARPRPHPRALGALSDEYAQNVSDFKALLSKNNAAAQQKYNQEHAGEQVYHPPQYPSGPQGPTGEPGTTGTEAPDTREGRDFSREGAVGPEANLPPPTPVISVAAGDEVPPPIPVPPKTPGGHSPVVTGVWDPDRYVPYVPPPLPPEPETSACGPGYSRTVPGGPCVKNTPTGENYGYACYQCADGSAKWTRTPDPGCTPNGASQADCKPEPKSLPPPVYPWQLPPAMPNITSPTINPPTGSFAGGEGLDTGVARFASAGLSGPYGLGAPALLRPVRMAWRPW